VHLVGDRGILKELPLFSSCFPSSPNLQQIKTDIDNMGKNSKANKKAKIASCAPSLATPMPAQSPPPLSSSANISAKNDEDSQRQLMQLVCMLIHVMDEDDVLARYWFAQYISSSPDFDKLPANARAMVHVAHASGHSMFNEADRGLTCSRLAHKAFKDIRDGHSKSQSVNGTTFGKWNRQELATLIAKHEIYIARMEMQLRLMGPGSAQTEPTFPKVCHI
jgi:hypothetical protein